jgi:ribosomal protein S17E
VGEDICRKHVAGEVVLGIKRMGSKLTEKYKQYFQNTFDNCTNQDRKTGT